jgi:hypothetical protein
MPANKQIIFVGDTHGEWNKLFNRLYQYQISDAYLIHVGDIGIGFSQETKEQKLFSMINDELAEKNIKFLGIRGNHDDPKYFDGRVCLSHFELVPDYTAKTINREKFLFVGGAVSIDRIKRVPNMSWWHDEKIVFDPERIKSCDVLVTHSAPSWNGPFDKSNISSWCENDTSLWEECVEERQLINQIIEICKPAHHFCGHFHCSAQAINGYCISRILDSHDFYEYKKYENIK